MGLPSLLQNTIQLAQSSGPSYLSQLGSAIAGNPIGALGAVAGLFSGSSGPKQPSFQDQVDVQKQFARTGIQWRVEDAQRSGIHPLYAIGAPAISFSPVSVGGSDGPSLPERLSGFGQDISRAIDSTRNSGQRAEARITSLAIERGELENQMLRLQMAKLAADQVGPPMAGSSYSMPGQPASGVLVNPSETTVTGPHPWNEKAAAPANKLFLNADGTVSVWPSAEAKQSVEDSWYEYEHMLRNRIIPAVQNAARRSSAYFGFRR